MKRRDFVIKSGMASLALASTTSVLARINPFENKNNTINVGVIGTGSRGNGMIPFINEIPNLKVIACCDILPSHLAEGIKRAEGNPQGYSDYRKLLENKDIDAIYMATPFNTHSEIGIASLQTGKHVYGEKTMAKGYDGIKDLVAAKPENLIYQTGHQYHSSRLYTHVVDLIKNGKVGEISSFQCQWNRFGDWRRPVPSPDLEKLINWRMYKEFSGGLVAELCSHQIDFVNWVLDATPKQVMGTGGIDYWKDGRETYDNIHLIYSYPNGVEAKFTCLTTNAKDDYQIKVIGSKGTIILDYTQAWFYPEGNYDRKLGEVDGVSGATVQWEEGKGIPIHVNHADPSKQALMDFRDSILNNQQPLSNEITGAKTAIAVQMALDAMYENKIVEWNSDYDRWLS
ncbi:MAG: Gfo/Idh/MocA family oxidoreductase [Christiangramia sp.]|uniref:Gfo/Idh/MocA family protein n=1 Tax=Christiangramia sp. TaxID=1931228 RepID=UPI003242CE90